MNGIRMGACAKTCALSDPPIVLASASPRREELLRRVGLNFTVQPADVDESLAEPDAPERDVVRLAAATPSGAAPRLGSEGVLEGTGEPLARVRLIPVTEPVEVGDEVYTGAAAGVLARPLLYGRVVRVERPIGAAHWEIWMEPAVDGRPERVAVLRIELNPRRVGQRPLPKTPKR